MHSGRWSKRRVALWILGIAVIAGFGVFAALDMRMNDAGGPGIARFEFVADKFAAERILEAWGEDGRDAARLSLWFDFGFSVLYAVFLALAIRACSDSLRALGRDNLAWLGTWLWVWPIFAAAFDMIENAALLLVLDGTSAAAWPSIATHAAVVKFSFVIGSLLYLIVGCTAITRARRATAD